MDDLAPRRSAGLRGIQWVLLDGALHFVGELRGASRARRATARCPVCEERVIPKLGPVRIAHAAHRPGSHCAVRSGEGALHFNTKHALAEALISASPRELVIELPCTGAIPTAEELAATTYPSQASHARCLEWRRHAFAQGWDEVRVEQAVGDQRPDVVLLQGGVPICAIEVRVAHAVDVDKADAFAVAQMPWIEIDATVAPFAEGYAWTTAAPLRVVAFGPWTHGAPPAEFTCEIHAGEQRRRTQSVAEQQRAFAARVVDRYPRASDTGERACIVLDAVIRAGQVVAVQARRDDARDHSQIERVTLTAPLQALTAARAWALLHNPASPLADAATQAWERLATGLWSNRDVFDPMPWAPAAPVLTHWVDATALDWWPFRYERRGAQWIRSPEFASDAWDVTRRTPDPRATQRAERDGTAKNRKAFLRLRRAGRALLPTASAGEVPTASANRLLAARVGRLATSFGPAWTWATAGGAEPGARPPWAIVLVMRGVGPSTPASAQAAPAADAAVIRGNQRDDWDAVARELRASGAEPLFVALTAPERARERWTRPDLPILQLSERVTPKPAVFVALNVDGGPVDALAVGEGLRLGSLRWDLGERRWRWVST